MTWPGLPPFPSSLAQRFLDLVNILQAAGLIMAPSSLVGSLLWLAALALPALRAADAAATASSPGKCRCFPGDTCWPSIADWSAFNATIDGGLIAIIPLAQPCHDPKYNATTCNNLRDNWLYPQQQYVLHKYLGLDFPDQMT